MRLSFPIANFNWRDNTSQLFGVNKQVYQQFNIPGHNGLDFYVKDAKTSYGVPILATHDGIVDRLQYETSWRTNGNGIYLLSDEGFSTVYWHLSEIHVNIGQQVKRGDVLGLMGNTGFVLPPPDASNPHNGTHLHFAIFDSSQKDNEYHGFIDPAPYLINDGDKLPTKLVQDLFIGNSYGNQVANLQTILKLEGFAQEYEPNGSFGPKTMRDVILLQQKYGLTPAIGYCGAKTRSVLNARWSAYN